MSRAANRRMMKAPVTTKVNGSHAQVTGVKIIKAGDQIRVFLGYPYAHQADPASVVAYAESTQRPDNVLVTRGLCKSSILTHSMNIPWAHALNAYVRGEITHYAMLHSDVVPCPQAGWLDIMVDTMKKTKSDLLSVVLPIKDWRGLTSTAIYDKERPWTPRRLTMQEVFKNQQDWFSIPGLLANTGIFLCDLRNESWWRDPKSGACRVWFRQSDKVLTLKRKTDPFLAASFSEDWHFTRTAAKRGAKVAVCRNVIAYHGRQEFNNQEAWGEWETDHHYAERINPSTGVPAPERDEVVI